MIIFTQRDSTAINSNAVFQFDIKRNQDPLLTGNDYCVVASSYPTDLVDEDEYVILGRYRSYKNAATAMMRVLFALVEDRNMYSMSGNNDLE